MLLIEMQYLGPVSYYALLYGYGQVLIEREETFVKSTYRNRCIIQGASGPLRLSIPLEDGRDHHRPYKDTRISYRENWQRYHWKCIESAYRNSPYFEHYEHQFKPFYEEKFELLFDYNEHLLLLVCRLLKLKTPISYTHEFKKVPDGDITDLRSRLHPNPEKNQTGYLIKTIPYNQVFADRTGFQPGLSIIDLLFNEGPGSLSIIGKYFAL